MPPTVFFGQTDYLHQRNQQTAPMHRGYHESDLRETMWSWSRLQDAIGSVIGAASG